MTSSWWEQPDRAACERTGGEAVAATPAPVALLSQVAWRWLSPPHAPVRHPAFPPAPHQPAGKEKRQEEFRELGERVGSRRAWPAPRSPACPLNVFDPAAFFVPHRRPRRALQEKRR